MAMVRLRRCAVHLEVRGLERIPFQRAVAHADAAPRGGVILLRRAGAEEPVIGVAGDAVAVPATQELEHRHAQRLALDVEHGGLDGAQGGAEHRARAPVAVAVELLDQGVRPEGIAADEPALQLLQRGDDGKRLPLQGGFADAVDAVVRIELDEHEVRSRDVGDESLEPGDPHDR